MSTSITKSQNRPIWTGIQPIRACLVLIVLSIVMVFLYVYAVVSEQQVYACADKDRNPVDVQLHCQQLTKNQWWGAYYGGKK